MNIRYCFKGRERINIGGFLNQTTPHYWHTDAFAAQISTVVDVN